MYIVTYLIDLAALLFLIGIVVTSSLLSEGKKRPLAIAIIITIAVIIAEMITVLTGDGMTSFFRLNRLSNAFGFALPPIIPIVILSIFDNKILKEYKYFLIPTLINTVLAFLSSGLGLLFYVDKDNNYTRGSLFYLFVAVCGINLFMLFVRTIYASNRCHYSLRIKMIIIVIFTMVGFSIQLFYPSAYSTWHCVTLSLFLYFIVIFECESNFDTLTGFYNRAAFNMAVKKVEKMNAFSLVLLDIDNFKRINDDYGHEYGDTIMKRIADIILKSFDKHFTCYRYGGDEFVIIGKSIDRETIESYLNTMSNDLAEMPQRGDLKVTISYGHTIFNGNNKCDFSDIFNQVDEQMYQSKRKRKMGVDTDPEVIG